MSRSVSTLQTSKPMTLTAVDIISVFKKVVKMEMTVVKDGCVMREMLIEEAVEKAVKEAKAESAIEIERLNRENAAEINSLVEENKTLKKELERLQKQQK